MKCYKCDTPLGVGDKQCTYKYDNNCYIVLCAACHLNTRRRYKVVVEKLGDKRMFGYGSMEEAIIVKMIFTLRYHPDRRFGAKTIADVIYREGYRNRKGNKIATSQIQRILNNEDKYKEEGFI
jgi:hypothetical protein